MENFMRSLGDDYSTRSDPVPEICWQAEPASRATTTVPLSSGDSSPPFYPITPRQGHTAANGSQPRPLVSMSSTQDQITTSLLSHQSFPTPGSSPFPYLAAAFEQEESPFPNAPHIIPSSIAHHAIPSESMTSPIPTAPSLQFQFSLPNAPAQDQASDHEKRKAKNRLCQRASRQRQLDYIGKLESTVDELSQTLQCVEVERDELQRELEKVKGVLGRVVTQRAASGVVAEWSKTPDTERAPDGMEVRVLDLGSIHVVEKVQRGGQRRRRSSPLLTHGGYGSSWR